MGKCPQVEKSDGSYGLLQFRNIRPDWRGSLANLGFVLTLDVGGQHFASDTGSVQLRRGFPVPNEVIGILLAEADGHYQLIDTSFWIDGGDVVVNVSKFDPANFSTLNLSVLPLLPDPAFVVKWEEPSDLKMPTAFAEYTKCKESPLLSERLKICGATNGIDTKPITVQVDLWTGRPQSSLQFTIGSVSENAMKVPSDPHPVRMNFRVDSPAAWAAEIYNCTLLDRTVSVKRSVLESADATCALLKGCSNAMLGELCGSIKNNGFGGYMVYMPGKKTYETIYPLLPPGGVLKVMAYMMIENHDGCKMPRNWSHDNAGILHLKHYGAKVPVKAFVRQLEEMEEKAGLAWLQTMEITSSQFAQCSNPNDSPSPTEFDREVARTAWEVARMSALPKVLRILGFWKENMPQLLLDELVASHRMEIKDLTIDTSLTEIFKEVKVLKADLAEASDLRFSILALNLAENLENFTVRCFRCGDLGTPAAKDWEDLSKQLTKVQHLRLDHFILRYPKKLLTHARSLTTLALAHDQITTLPEDLFRGLSSLTTVDLQRNQFTTLPKEVFRNLSNLETLDLNSNHLTTLPGDVFHGLAKLADLHLDRNQITTLPKRVFHGLSSLETLDLHENQITGLPEKVFDGLSRLKALCLQYNPITTLPKEVFHGLWSLEILELGVTRLTMLPDRVFHGLSNLKSLHLYRNPLTTLPEDVFHGLWSLEILDLSTNQFTSLPKKVFRGLLSLETLMIGNHLKTLPEDVFHNLSSLKTLDLQYNQITKLSKRVFHGLSSLETLDLCYNHLKMFPEAVFHGLSSLETLRLNNNQITTLPEKVFHGLSSLKMLGLAGNELSKDDIQSLRSNLTSLGVKIEF